MGCTFCASTLTGLCRNLTPSEMLSEVYLAAKDAEEHGEKIASLVLMGIGEPLDNFDNVMDFLTILSSDNGFNLGMRHISLSTCGLVDKIYKLAERKLQLTLSVSLHAPNDEIRTGMMPVNRAHNIAELLLVEIACACPGGKSSVAQINRISTAVYCILQCVCVYQL